MTVCAYCEQNTEELTILGFTLSWCQIGRAHVQLCDACRLKYAPAEGSVTDEWLKTPVVFPPGIVQVEHSCPRTAGEITSVLVLNLSEDGYNTAQCPSCGVIVKSRPV